MINLTSGFTTSTSKLAHPDLITFQSTTMEEIETDFVNSIDDYLKWYREDGVQPEKPYSEKFNLRISPKLHREIAIASFKMNLSLNKFVEKALIDELSNQDMG